MWCMAKPTALKRRSCIAPRWLTSLGVGLRRQTMRCARRMRSLLSSTALVGQAGTRKVDATTVSQEGKKNLPET